MLDLLLKLSAFLVAVIILVTVHEFGHFWVARRLGVKVLKFSIGFGRPLLTWRRRNDPTEYVIAAIPAGGYVKMLDEREDPVAEAELPQAFNRQRLWVRSAIVIAGPAFNFLFALLLYWLLYMAGQSGLKPEIGEVVPQSIAAEAGFQSGDLVLAVDDRPTPTWSAFWLTTLSEGIDGDDLSIRVRRPDGSEQVRLLNGDQLAELEPGQGFLDEIGDQILRIDDTEISDWQALVKIVQAQPDQDLSMTIQRGTELLRLSIRPRALEVDGQLSGRIGAGVQYPEALLAEQEVWVHYGPIEAAVQALRRVLDVSVLTLQIVAKMLVGQASIENISSPIGIANAAGQTASYGLISFVQFLALLSVSLGLINLFPIPVLDGGHLLYFAIEGVTGRPLSEEVQQQGQRVGIALLISLMTLAFYVDIARFLG